MKSRIAMEIQRKQEADCVRQYRILFAVTLVAVVLPPAFLLAGWLLTLGPWSVVPHLGFVPMADYLSLHSKLPEFPNALLVWAGLYLLIIAVSVVGRRVHARLAKKIRSEKGRAYSFKKLRSGYLVGLLFGGLFLLLMRGGKIFHFNAPAWLAQFGIIAIAVILIALGLILIAKIGGWALGSVADAVLCVFGGADRLLVEDSIESSCSMLRVLTRRVGFLALVLGLLTVAKAAATVWIFIYQSLQIMMFSVG